MMRTEQQTTSRPGFAKDKHLEYLDAIRLSGVTNMFGAASYLLCEFPELDKRQACAVLQYWMTNFKG
jgi:hypothetical protein